MSRRALLVGINDFGGRVNSLSGCVNDTLTMRRLLTQHFTFADDQVRTLNDRDASRRGIEDGLAWLLSDYDGDDVRLFHFSSHGTQVPDQTKDEWDCYDEVIVPHDHDWNRPFRDDDLRAIFETIPASVHFTFVADCCHSGTIQKGITDSGIAFQPRWVDPPAPMHDEIVEAQRKRDVDAREYILGELRKAPPDLSRDQLADMVDGLLQRHRENRYQMTVADRHVLLAACQDRQTAADAYLDGRYQGALTWALAKAVDEHGSVVSYAQLIKQAGANLKEFDQRPQLSCPKGLRAHRVLAPLD